MTEVAWDRNNARAHVPKPQCDCRKHEPCRCGGKYCHLCEHDPRHGTVNGYVNYSCRCERCRTAHAIETYRRSLARRRRIPEHVHGTPNGYGNWGCRCDDCTAAYTKDAVARRERSKRGETDCARGLTPKPRPRW